MAVVGYTTSCLDLWLVKINFVRKAGHYQLDSQGLGQFHLDSSKPINTLNQPPEPTPPPHDPGDCSGFVFRKLKRREIRRRNGHTKRKKGLPQR